jgi:hypothetical protein
MQSTMEELLENGSPRQAVPAETDRAATL